MRYTKLLMMVSIILLSTIAFSFAFGSYATIFEQKDGNISKYIDNLNESSNFNFENAKTQVKSENPNILVESISGGLVNDDVFGKIWTLTSETPEGAVIFSGISAVNGNIVFTYDGSKNIRGIDVIITSDDAVEIADKYIVNKKVDDNIVFDTVRYHSPAAADLPATYGIHYKRIIKGIPSMSDGIRINVNAETGEVSSYRRRWSMPESQIVDISIEPTISAVDAGDILKKYMESSYPIYQKKNVAEGMKVHSSELIWKDHNYRETNSHDIRLTWWIRFDDPSCDNMDLKPAAWIDAHSGEVLTVAYSIG
ncbi:MAG: YcdB/YcdC domain-containing protein [Methanosarcinaceae archaeon]